MAVSELLEIIRGRAAAYGLNLIGAVPAARYDAAVPAHLRAQSIDAAARSIVVIGNGGGAFWHAYRRHADNHPDWTRREHPLDDFTRHVIETDLTPPVRERGIRLTVVYPFVSGAAALHFMELGRIAGIGGPSLLGVLINPQYGTWIALRAALLIGDEIDEPGAAAGFDPCPQCAPRSCISACPAGAVSGGGWDVIGCVRYRVEREPDCTSGCHARMRCVIAPQHRYPDDELRHHQERALRSMREYYRRHLAE